MLIEHLYHVLFCLIAAVALLGYLGIQEGEIKRKKKLPYDCTVEGTITDASVFRRPTKIEVEYEVDGKKIRRYMTKAEVTEFYNTKSKTEQIGRLFQMDFTNKVGEKVIVDCFRQSPFNSYIHK